MNLHDVGHKCPTYIRFIKKKSDVGRPFMTDIENIGHKCPTYTRFIKENPT